jgi:hypothetical protein
MSDDRIIGELRSRAAAGGAVVPVLLWLRDELGPTMTYFQFMGYLFKAFEIPVEKVRMLELWRGISSDGRLSDEEIEVLLSPLVPRTGPNFWARP